MNSQERHEARYQRRKARREQRAREAGGASFEEVMSFGNICKAGKSCCDGARWKTSTINFETNLLGEAQATYDTLHYGKRVFKGFHSFATVEHGKVRNIDALPIQERAIQKCLCKNLLTEVYSRTCRTITGGMELRAASTSSISRIISGACRTRRSSGGRGRRSWTTGYTHCSATLWMISG